MKRVGQNAAIGVLERKAPGFGNARGSRKRMKAEATTQNADALCPAVQVSPIAMAFTRIIFARVANIRFAER